MALNEPATWLIAYDIRCPRRLKRVHRYLSSVAVHVQYSVFVTRSTPQKLGTVRAALNDLIDDRSDDVRIYRVPENPAIETLGAQGLPEGILLLSPSRSESGGLPITSKAR
jgi:CRISPR-associated protein Cas2